MDYQIKKQLLQKADPHPNVWVGKTYLGSPHEFYSVRSSDIKAIAKNVLKQNDLSAKEVLELVGNLVKGSSLEERIVASFLLEYSKEARNLLTPKIVESYLNHLVGWAEIDALSTRVFSKDNEILKDWDTWVMALKKFSRDKNINKRRASLVLLIRPARYLNDKRVLVLSLELIDSSKTEREVIITKAISWLLRALLTYHTKEVHKYINKNKDTLPKIVIREVTKKITTGEK